MAEHDYTSKPRLNPGFIFSNKIEGVSVVDRRLIEDPRGYIQHILKTSDPEFEGGIGEVYASSVERGVVKGWHNHKLMTLRYMVLGGKIQLALCDMRENSPTYKNFMELGLSAEGRRLVTIPPGVWNGFRGIRESNLVLNTATHQHTPEEIERYGPYGAPIGYDWAVRDF